MGEILKRKYTEPGRVWSLKNGGEGRVRKFSWGGTPGGAGWVGDPRSHDVRWGGERSQWAIHNEESHQIYVVTDT